MRKETSTELKYDCLKDDLHKCDICNEWIEFRPVRIYRNKKYYFYHPFCYLCATKKIFG